MPQKVKNSGKSAQFQFSVTGSWQTQQIHGWLIYVDAKHEYTQYSPRMVAIAEALRQFWIMNRGTRFGWRDNISNLRFYVRGVGRVTRDDFSRAKEIIRELGPGYMTPEGETFIYASTRGSNAVSGFILEPIDAMKYESMNHQMYQVMEGRVANGTVDPAGAAFAVPVHKRKMTTKTLR